MGITLRPGKRRMRWVVQYRDSTGTRRYKTCFSLDEAKKFEAEKILEPGGNPLVKVSDIASRWLEVAAAKVRPQTHEQYRGVVRLHILPTLGDRRVASVRPSDIELLLVQKLNGGLKAKPVSHIQTVLFGILKRAVRDGIIHGNPAAGLVGELGLRRKARVYGYIKALDTEQLGAFLAATRVRHPHLYLMFFTMVSTGIRIGEAIAVLWDDVDFEGVEDKGELVYGITIQRNMLKSGKTDQTKSARIRRVDLDDDVRDALWTSYQDFLERNLRTGRTLDDWAFPNPRGGHLYHMTIRTQFKQILEAAELPSHFTPHSLRHTFASVHIALGTELPYLKEQLGHASIQMTYDIYGHWLSKSDKSAARRFQEALGGAKRN